MDISMQMSRSKNRGHTYKVMHAALQAIRRNGGTLIGIPDNALGDGQPNLLTAPEFAGGLTDAPTRGGLLTLASLAGYDNALAFGRDGTTTSYAYKTYTHTVGITYALSVIVRMDDSNAPSFAATNDGTIGANSFALVMGGAVINPTLVTSQLQSDGSYRVSAQWTATGSTFNWGVIKYNTNDARTFKVTGYKLEQGSVATAYTPQSVLRQRGTYQDSIGTMPVTAVGDLLGLLTDRSYGAGNLGPELVPATYYGSVTGGWVISPTSITRNGTTSTACSLALASATVSTKLYRVEFTVSNLSGDTFTVNLGGANVGQISTNGRKSFAIAGGGSGMGFVPWGGTAGQLTVTDVTVREVPGNHATQPTPAQKPTLVQVPKRLGVEMIASQDLTTWTSGGAFGNWAGTTSTATTITTTGTNGGRYVRLPCTTGKTYTFAALVTAGTGQGAVAIAYGTSGNVLISEQTSLFTGAGVARCTTVAPANAAFVEFVVRGGTSGQTVTFASLSAGEVLEWTNAISFNGSSQFLNCGIATGNEGWLCAGVTFGGTASTNETIFANGAGSATQRGVWLVRDGTSSGVNNSFRMGVGNGTALTMATTTALPLIGTPRVVEGGWTASNVFVGVDGNIMTTARTGDTTPAPQPSLIGCYASGIHTMQGPMTAFLHCQTVPTEVERDIIRKWMAQTNRAPYWGELQTLSLDFVSGDYLISNGEV